MKSILRIRYRKISYKRTNYDRYARYDHFDVLEKVMPIMTKFDMEFRDSYITDNKLYLRATFPNIERDIGNGPRQKGDIVRLGLMISNSETGMGQLEAGPIIERLVCTNGMVTDSRYAIKRKHLVRLETIADREILREETIIQQDKAWLMTPRIT